MGITTTQKIMSPMPAILMSCRNESSASCSLSSIIIKIFTFFTIGAHNPHAKLHNGMHMRAGIWGAGTFMLLVDLTNFKPLVFTVFHIKLVNGGTRSLPHK